MQTVRRYGPSAARPAVSPRPDLGRGREQSFENFKGAFDTANQFLRPAVEQIQTAKGEREAIEAVREHGPRWGLREIETGETTVTTPGTGPRVRPGPTRVRAAAARAEQQYGLEAGTLVTFGILESGLDPGAQNPNSSAGGWLQFIDSTAEGYGLEDRFDVDQSADAGGRLTRDNMRVLAPALGRQPTIGELYLAHQQGAQGALDLLTAPAGTLAADVVGVEAVRLNGGDPASMTAQDFANLWIEKANNAARNDGISVTIPNPPEYELETINGSSFEPRLPFTVRDAAFNASADRVITARAQSALEQGMTAAISRADGDMDALNKELEELRKQVFSELPANLPNLATDLQAQFDRGSAVAQRQVVELAERRVLAEQETALTSLFAATRGEAERLALTGASPDELADHMAASLDQIAQYGPREEFTVAGRTYPADPSRAGIMTPAVIAQQAGSITSDARRLMIRAEFERSNAPGQFAAEFRQQVLSGNSPLPPGESLELLASIEAQARQRESRLRTTAEAERRRLEQDMDTTINAYVSLNEAGVPVAIPAEERSRILANLSPYPELQREALIAFAVADAQVQTHGMTGPELMAYTDQVRSDIAAAAENGELDLEGAAVIASLEDELKAIEYATTAETIGLPLVEQLVMNGREFDQVNYDGLRERANGNPDVIAAINEVEAFHRDIATLEGMTATQREEVLNDTRAALGVLAAQGRGFGAGALQTSSVLDKLEEWSQHQTRLAETDPLKFAEAQGIAMPSFEGVETLSDAGGIIAQRVDLLAPATALEGVPHPVPLSQAELDAISEVFAEAPRADKTAFLASVAELGDEQAMAVFSRIGQAEPTLYAAGTVYTMGNQEAAAVILRGSVDTRLDGGSATEVAAARQQVLGPLLSADLVRGDDIELLDATAMAYARGTALADGGSPIDQARLREGYQIALGRQADGTGGLAETRYGATVAPPGWTAREINRAVSGMSDDDLTQMAQGLVVDGAGRPIDRRALLRSIEGLEPTDDPFILTPFDGEGNVFMTESGNGIGVLQIDLRKLN